MGRAYAGRLVNGLTAPRSVLAMARTSDSRRVSSAPVGPVGHHELDLEIVGLVDLDHGAEISLSKAVLRQVPVEHHGLERLELHGCGSG
jgi:hypothetical protein